MHTKKKKIKSKSLLIVVTIVTLIVGSSLGFVLGRLTTTKTITSDQSIYTTLASIIENQFMDTTESDASLEDRMLSGMLSGLGDTYSSYMNSAAYSDFVSSVNGSLKGIGIGYSDYGIGAMVTEVYSDSPAYKAGMEKGDFITKINDTAIIDNEDVTIRELIKQKDTVRLVFYRNGKQYEKQIQLEDITVSVTYSIQDEKIGYINISTFGNSTASNIEKALQYFQNNQIKTVCLDLRNNSGGYLKSAQDVLNLFVPTGVTMFKTQNKKGKTDYKSDDSTKYTFDQGFVLVNNDTASASEIVTSSLSENLNYQIIGEQTFGKGIVQTEIALSSTQTIKLTTCKWLTPNGNYIHGTGITPHYEVENTTLLDYTFAKLDEPIEYDDVDGTVLYMQKALKVLGYKVDRTDGYFSKKTSTCLKQFEKDHGFVLNGRLTNEEAILLFSEVGHYYNDQSKDNVYQKMKELVN